MKPRLKQALASVLLLAQLSAGVPLARADENQQTKALEDILKTLKSEYPGLIRESFKSLTDGYFSLRLEDLTKSAMVLRAYAGEGHHELQALKVRLDEVLGHFGRVSEKDAIELRSIKTDTLAIKSRAETLVADFGYIVEGWKKRCDADTLQYANARFNPKTQFSANRYNLTPNGGDWVIGMQVTFGYGAQGQPVAANASYETTGMLATTGLAIGASTGPLAPILAPVGAIVGATIGIFIGTFNRAAEINRQWELIGEINDFQDDAIAELAGGAQSFIAQRCQLILPDELAGKKKVTATLEAIREDLALHARVAKQLSDLSAAEYLLFQERMGQSIDELAADEFKKIDKAYFAQLERTFADARAVDRAAQGFVNSKLLPLLAKPALPEGPLAASNRSYELWDQMIRGDVKFRGDSDFTFAEAATDEGLKPVNSAKWVSTARALKKRISP